MKPKQNDTPKYLEELSGQPGSDSVSKVAKGERPETVKAEFIRTADEIHSRRYEDGEEVDKSATDIQEAYAKLFESLSEILRCK
jgi:hypothetical protein